MFDTSGVESKTIQSGARTYEVTAYNHPHMIEVSACITWSDHEGDHRAMIGYTTATGQHGLTYRRLPADDYDTAEQVFAEYITLAKLAASYA